MSMYFELHITIKPSDLDVAKSITDLRWLYPSTFFGDPDLGNAKMSYLTAKNTDFSVLRAMAIQALDKLRIAGIHPLRMKIESAIMDERYAH